MVHVPHLDPRSLQVLGQILRHLLGEGRHQHPLIPGRPGVDLSDEIVDLPRHGPDLHSGVQQARGPDDLLHDLIRLTALVLRRGGGDEHRLMEPLLELIELQGPVVEGAGKTVLDKALLPGPVAVEHGPDLGQGHVALIYEQYEIIREVVDQRHGRGPHRPSGDDPAVVFDAVAVPQLPHHLNVVGGPLANALGLHQLAVLREPALPVVQLPLDFPQSPLHFLPADHVMTGGPDGDVGQPPGDAPGNGVDLTDPVDLVPEKFHPQGRIPPVGGP